MKKKGIPGIPLVNHIFYYEGFKRTTTVCLLLKDRSVIARGVAICSPLDQFVKRIGRTKALGMAAAAIHRKENSRQIRSCGNRILQARRFAYHFKYRSCYCPILTERETDLVARYYFE